MSAHRYDFYQTDTHVVVSLFVRNQKAEDVHVTIAPQERTSVLTVTMPTTTWHVELSHAVEPTPAQVRVVAPKIELTLVKAERGVTWPRLLAAEAASAPTAVSSTAAPRARSKWDELDLSEADDRPPSGSGDAELHAFFQQLYANADDDTRRAMVKSFQESGGTALSTNWADVGQKTMEVRAPAGMEARTYEQ